MEPAKGSNTAAAKILRTYVTLTLLSTFSSSLIWGINTLFLLDAGLSITKAFAANAFFTLGEVLFEVPTGVVADTIGRRASYLLGSATLFATTLLYLYLWRTHGPFWAWAVVSMLLGLGFTFFSGATEAWLVDGLKHAKYEGTMESAFAKGQIAGGIAMLAGTVAGGFTAQLTNLGVPYALRAVMLGLTFVVALTSMHDIGFVPEKRTSTVTAMGRTLHASWEQGLRRPAVRWLMLSAPFSGGVGMYAFYAMQPYLLELHGGSRSYAIAGIAAAIVAATQIAGGFLVPYARVLFRLRTSLLLASSLTTAGALVAIGLVPSFVAALGLMGVWGIVFAGSTPVRQAYINALIPSESRATVLSFDNLLSSSGAVIAQPALGRAADVWSYGTSYLVAGAIELLTLPFIVLARREKAPSDPIPKDLESPPSPTPG
jgi:MFS family permease